MELPRLFSNEPRESLHAEFQPWFAGDLGQQVLQAEQRLVARILPDLFGYHALQIGHMAPVNLLQSSRIRHCCVAAPALPQAQGLSPLQARPEQLPFANGSVDLVLLHHELDATASPHAVLREAARVLIPDGHLLVLGFNPWSVWGVWRFMGGLARAPWLRRPLGPHRLADWLALLDLELVGLESAVFAPPVAHSGLRSRFAWMDKVGQRFWRQGGAVYVLLARKRVSCITPITPLQRQHYGHAAPVFVTEARLRRWAMKREGDE